MKAPQRNVVCAALAAAPAEKAAVMAAIDRMAAAERGEDDALDGNCGCSTSAGASPDADARIAPRGEGESCCPDA